MDKLILSQTRCLMPTLDDFLRKETAQKKAAQASNNPKIFGMLDDFDLDPRKFCPECHLPSIKPVYYRHAIDYEGFKCSLCGFNYVLDYEPPLH